MSLHILFRAALTFILLFFCLVVFAHGKGDDSHNAKKWYFQDSDSFVEADFISCINGMVSLRLKDHHSIVKFPLESFSIEDQLIVMERLALIKKFNQPSKVYIKSGINRTTELNKSKVWNITLLLIIIIVSIFNFYQFSYYRKTSIISAIGSLAFLIIIACSKDEATATSPMSSSDASTSTTNEDTTSDSSTTENNDSESTSESTNDASDSTEDTDTSSGGNLIDTIISHFNDFSGVTITSDSEYFYINSYSWPEHGMGRGITSWQEQVPIPQNYTGDNSWTIPLNPEMSTTPLNTSEHLLKGALAVAVNGVPIFNVYNNRGENAYLIGELDDWGGHFGRGDDYHYHMVPTHLETTVGSENPLAYALDGYPIYGYTEETLDDGFGRYDSDGNYRYHAVNEAPYYIPVMKGVVTLDPATTAPEDQIYPQPVQNPVRSSSDFKGVNGAVVNGLSQTGTNAFSFEYTVSDVKYYVNYSWDENCNFTYTYVDENGNSSNLPTNGALAADSTENTETYNNVNFCKDVSLAGYTSSSDDSNVNDDSNSDTAYSATSTNSTFTLSSVAIDSNGSLLEAYKCEEKVEGIEKSIPIHWSNVPEGTNSLAISIHGFPKGTETSYLTLWNIDPSVSEIPYGGANDGDWYIGPNKDGTKLSYSSPCSPSGATATYYMTIYALSSLPPSLPSDDSLTVDYSTLIQSFSEVTIIDQVVLEYIAD